MIGGLTRRAGGLMAGGLLGAATIVASGACADIGFVRSGPFEVCLNGAYDAWLRDQAELLVNEDPRGRSLDDASVVAWTAATLDGCRKRGEANPGSVDRFGRHMAQWRDHVFDHAASIRQRGLSD
jgi:hypothetical protein